MATIGTFKKTGNEYVGEIDTAEVGFEPNLTDAALCMNVRFTRMVKNLPKSN